MKCPIILTMLSCLTKFSNSSRVSAGINFIRMGTEYAVVSRFKASFNNSLFFLVISRCLL